MNWNFFSATANNDDALINTHLHLLSGPVLQKFCRMN